MSWNNIIPVWIMFNTCPNCGKKVKDRKNFPGAECEECGGKCILENE